MNSGFLLIGAVTLLVGTFDLLWTTLWIEEGAGPLTGWLMAGVWRTVRRVGTDVPRVLTVAGPLVLLGSLTTWIALLWGGWTLVLAGGEPAIVDVQGGGPISWFDRAYFAGYAIFTLGNGDFAPTTGVWQLVTVLASASGLLLITLAVTYVLSVLDAVTQKRAVASDVDGLGSTGPEIVLSAWTDEGFRGLDVSLDTIASELNTLTSNHKAYPILHYFHSRQPQQSPTSRVATLDEALTLLECGVTEDARPPELIVRPARSSVGNYLETVEESFVSPADRAPPPPDLEALRAAGVPVVPESAFRESVESLDGRRRKLRGLAESDLRAWPADAG